MEFNVGDKVVVISGVINGKTYNGIGTVIRITEKRKDVVVDFGNYKTTFDRKGWMRNRDLWSMTYIKPLTPEIEEEIRQTKIIKKCRVVFDKNRNKITADQAERILAILLEGEQ